MTTHVTVEAFNAGLEKAVKDRGSDYVYTDHPELTGGPVEREGLGGAISTVKCMYVAPSGKQPGCLYGTALHNAGVPLEELSDWETCPASTLISHFVEGSTPHLRMASRMGQVTQDGGGTWGEAYRDHQDEMKNAF